MSQKPKVSTIEYFQYADNIIMSQPKDSEITCMHNCNVNETNVSFPSNLRNRNTNGTLKQDTFILKEPIVLLQRLSNIIRVVPSSLSSSSSMIRITDQFGNIKLNISRKMFNTIINYSENVLRSSNKKNFKTKFYNRNQQRNVQKFDKKSITMSPFKKSLHNEIIASQCSSNKDTSKLSISVLHRRLNSNSHKVTPAIYSFIPSSQLHCKSHSFTKPNSVPMSSCVSRVKKSDSKYSTVKKIPNFAEIHKKMFARSESIIDAKKKLKDRHTALTKLNSPANVMKINLQEEILLSNKSNKHFDSHLEFKMKKHETADCILKDYASHSTRGKQQSKAKLGGVKTNRRLELQMKSRNIDF